MDGYLIEIKGWSIFIRESVSSTILKGVFANLFKSEIQILW